VFYQLFNISPNATLVGAMHAGVNADFHMLLV